MTHIKRTVFSLFLPWFIFAPTNSAIAAEDLNRNRWTAIQHSYYDYVDQLIQTDIATKDPELKPELRKLIKTVSKLFISRMPLEKIHQFNCEKDPYELACPVKVSDKFFTESAGIIFIQDNLGKFDHQFSIEFFTLHIAHLSDIHDDDTVNRIIKEIQSTEAVSELSN